MSLLDEGRRGFSLGVRPTVVRGLAVLVVTLFLLCAQSIAALRPTLRPDLVTLVVVFLALQHEILTGLVLALAVGYLGDLFSGAGPGLGATTSATVFLLLRLFVVRLVGTSGPMVTAMALFSTALALVIRLGIQMTLGPAGITLGAMVPALPSIFIGALLLAYPVFRGLEALDARLRPREEVGIGAR